MDKTYENTPYGHLQQFKESHIYRGRPVNGNFVYTTTEGPSGCLYVCRYHSQLYKIGITSRDETERLTEIKTIGTFLKHDHLLFQDPLFAQVNGYTTQYNPKQWSYCWQWYVPNPSRLESLVKEVLTNYAIDDGKQKNIKIKNLMKENKVLTEDLNTIFKKSRSRSSQTALNFYNWLLSNRTGDTGGMYWDKKTGILTPKEVIEKLMVLSGRTPQDFIKDIDLRMSEVKQATLAWLNISPSKVFDSGGTEIYNLPFVIIKSVIQRCSAFVHKYNINMKKEEQYNFPGLIKPTAVQSFILYRPKPRSKDMLTCDVHCYNPAKRYFEQTNENVKTPPNESSSEEESSSSEEEEEEPKFVIAEDNEKPSEIAKKNGWEVTALLKANKHIKGLRASARLIEGTKLFEPDLKKKMKIKKKNITTAKVVDPEPTLSVSDSFSSSDEDPQTVPDNANTVADNDIHVHKCLSCIKTRDVQSQPTWIPMNDIIQVAPQNRVLCIILGAEATKINAIRNQLLCIGNKTNKFASLYNNWFDLVQEKLMIAEAETISGKKKKKEKGDRILIIGRTNIVLRF
jgi:hypothetical protein